MRIYRIRMAEYTRCSALLEGDTVTNSWDGELAFEDRPRRSREPDL